MRHAPSTLLRNTLLANAVTSTLGGIVCFVANGLLVGFMGMADGLYLYIAGAALVIFGADVAYTATRTTLNPLYVKLIIGTDIAWVIGSFLVVALAPHLFSFAGIVVIEIVALEVAAFAIVQTIGLKRITPSSQHVAT